MSADPKHVQVLGALFDGISNARVQELGVKALRDFHAWAVQARNTAPVTFSIHGDLARHMLPLLLEEKPDFSGDTGFLADAFLFAPGQWGEPFALVLFLRWLERAGLAIGLGASVNGYPITYRITPRGTSFLQSANDDHPLLPRRIERLRSRCHGLPDEVLDLMADADECLGHGLLRPSVTIMGVAYEVSVEAVISSLVARGVVPGTTADASAARRIAAVKSVVDSQIVGRDPRSVEARYAAHAAYDFANLLRQRRNDASHTAPRWGFDDASEIEELLVSAHRHLPALWSMSRVYSPP